MKTKDKLMIAFLFTAAFLIMGCSEDFLERPPLSSISSENFYQTPNDLRLATAALYGGKPWGEWNYTCYLPVGEVLSGNMAVGYWGDAVQLHTFAVTGMNQIMVANWKSMYKIIAHCNTTINAIKEKAPTSISEKERNAAIAEAKFIRAYAYYNLVLYWGDVPIIEDNRKLVTSPLVYRNRTVDVHQFVIDDLKFAAKYLPVTDTPGRVTTWSAQGLLGKVYLTRSGLNSENVGQRDQQYLDSAKLYAGNVCKNSGRNLLPEYKNLFRSQFNNNPESLFALQWVSGSGWFEGNMLQIYCTAGNEISAAGQGGWFSISPTYDLYNEYTVADSLRRKATFMLKDDYYAELNQAGGGFKYNGSSGLKKHIIGTSVDNNAPLMTLTSSVEHNALLRLADVYLIYVEAILGNSASTSDGDALLYFNRVRTRAGLNPVTTIDVGMLARERRIELAAEGHFWEDIVRLSYYNAPAAIQFLDDRKTERVPFTYDNGVATKGQAYGVITSPTINTFKFPLPSSEVTANPKLLDAPVAYSF